MPSSVSQSNADLRSRTFETREQRAPLAVRGTRLGSNAASMDDSEASAYI